MDTIGIFPSFTEHVINRMIERDWLITLGNVDELIVYNPLSYIHHIHSDGCSFNLVLDRNIFSYILDCADERRATDNSRDALGLILFCQLSEINIEPTIALHEYVNFKAEKIDAAIEEVKIFRTVDNYNTSFILDYYMGIIDQLPYSVHPMESAKLEKSLSQNWLREWDDLYLVTLKLTQIHLSNKPEIAKLEEFISWMSESFKMTLVPTVFSAYLFSPHKIANMVKYKRNYSYEKKRASLYNMTWDLYFINRAFRFWHTRGENEEYLFASNDKAVQTVLKTVSQIGACGNYQPLKAILNKHLEKTELLIQKGQTNPNRAYNPKTWTRQHTGKLIQELEQQLL